MTAQPLACQRSLFSLPAELHYLNCAYMGPLSRDVEAAGVRGIARKTVPSAITARDFFEESDVVRGLFARLVHATDPHRIAILPAVSYGIATAARNTPCAKGQNIVTASEQFPSNVHVWRALARRTDAEFRMVSPPAGAYRGEAWNAALLDAIDADTAVVALPHVHWTDGTRFDLEAIGARARAVGAAFVIDGTQSIGALPFDVEAIRPDAVICAGYKWLLGPYSTTLGYFGPRYDDGLPLEETWIGRRGSEDFRGLVNYLDEYQPAAIRYDVGERSNFILLPMLLAALEQILEWRPDRIQSYCAKLLGDVLEEAAGLGFTVERPEWRASHLVGLRVPAGLDLVALQSALQDRNIFVSLRGSALRVSPNVYNDENDALALLEAIRAAAVTA